MSRDFKDVNTVTAGVFTAEHSASRNLLFSAIFWLTIADFIGLIAAIEMISPDFLAGIPWLGFGRVRQMHTNGVLFLWLSMAQVGAFFYIVPKLCGTSCTANCWATSPWCCGTCVGIGAIITLLQRHDPGPRVRRTDLAARRAGDGRLALAAYNIYRTILAARRRSSSSASGISWAP